MHAMPQTVPISEIRKDQEGVISRLVRGPILLLSRSQPAAVLVSVREWNEIAAIVERNEDLEDLIEMQRLEIEELKSGVTTTEPADIAELHRMAGRVPA